MTTLYSVVPYDQMCTINSKACKVEWLKHMRVRQHRLVLERNRRK